MRVDLVDVLSELGAWLSLYLLDLLETTRLNEGSLGFDVGWENLGKLGSYIGQDVVRGELQEWLKGWEMSAHLDNVLERFLGLVLKILRALWKHIDGKES